MCFSRYLPVSVAWWHRIAACWTGKTNSVLPGRTDNFSVPQMYSCIRRLLPVAVHSFRATCLPVLIVRKRPPNPDSCHRSHPHSPQSRISCSAWTKHSSTFREWFPLSFSCLSFPFPGIVTFGDRYVPHPLWMEKSHPWGRLSWPDHCRVKDGSCRYGKWKWHLPVHVDRHWHPDGGKRPAATWFYAGQSIPSDLMWRHW